MERRIAFGFTIALLVMTLLMAPSARANQVNQDFTIVITSMNWVPGIEPPSPWWSGIIDLSIGDRFNGYVTYNDASVPKTGPYVMGYAGDGVTAPWINEEQSFGVTVEGLLALWSWGYWYPWSEPQNLLFADGRLSGINIKDHVDLAPGVEDIGIWNNKYFAYGVDNDGNPWRIDGDVVIASVPEPYSVLLLGLGLAGLAGCRRIVKRHKTTTG